MVDRYDLVIVGMGSGGMVAAEFAATLDLKVAVAERGRVGGDCLWTGCVPSKTAIASGKVAHHMRHADEWGLEPAPPRVDRARVWERIRAVQQDVASTDDNPQRFVELGLDLVYGAARLTGPNTVVVKTETGDRELQTRYILLCTGSRPAVPDIEGLESVGFVTSETLFELTDPPATFVNIGGGPIAVEMVQAFTRLGMPTTLLQKGPRILPRDEPALVDILVERLRAEGVDLRFNVETSRVSRRGDKKVVEGTEDGQPTTWEADEILVAVGRQPNIDDLGLEELGIETGPKGVTVDNRGRTTVDTVYACGDVAGRHLFTHSAAYEGVRAVRDMFFPGKGKVVASVPWCTFTDPELAHAGMTEAEARSAYKDDVEVWRQDLVHNDRARADNATDGAILVITHKSRVVGAHILAPAAGEMIHEFALAIAEDVKLSELSQFMHVYPTVSTSVGQLAGEAAFEKAEKLRWLVKRK
ncbi:MAG TPA: FAD-dependent oxidoreductase [Acidimicrobiia bacterium]|nr:FAD-dependent oxidoreductase [Acidimicrobiia bacterium]